MPTLMSIQAVWRTHPVHSTMHLVMATRILPTIKIRRTICTNITLDWINTVNNIHTIIVSASVLASHRWMDGRICTTTFLSFSFLVYSSNTQMGTIPGQFSDLYGYGPSGFNNRQPNWNQGNSLQYYTGGSGNGLSNSYSSWLRSLQMSPFQGRPNELPGDRFDGYAMGPNPLMPIGQPPPMGSPSSPGKWTVPKTIHVDLCIRQTCSFCTCTNLPPSNDSLFADQIVNFHFFPPLSFPWNPRCLPKHSSDWSSADDWSIKFEMTSQTPTTLMISFSFSLSKENALSLTSIW